MNKKILVFGATGNTGLEICKYLCSNDIEYSVFSRKLSEEKINSDTKNIIFGDVLNIEDVEKAIGSTDFTDIIIALGSRDLKGGNVRSLGTKNIIDTLEKKKLNIKVHAISANGVRESWKYLKWYEKLITNLFLKKTMKDHELQEETIIKNKGGYTIIRPVALTNKAGTGEVSTTTGGVLPKGDISRADLAKFIVDNMSNKESSCISISN